MTREGHEGSRGFTMAHDFATEDTGVAKEIGLFALVLTSYEDIACACC
jgi:hypothetical protein